MRVLTAVLLVAGGKTALTTLQSLLESIVVFIVSTNMGSNHSRAISRTKFHPLTFCFLSRILVSYLNVYHNVS